jgi:hypothetical protein
MGITVTNQNYIYKEILNILILSSQLKTKIKIKIYNRFVNLLVILYEHDSRLVSSKEEGRLEMFENWGLRGIFHPERKEVTGDWRKFHDAEELHNLYSSPDIVSVM